MILREVFNGVLSGRLMLTRISSLITTVKEHNMLTVLLMLSSNLFRLSPLLNTIKPQEFFITAIQKERQKDFAKKADRLVFLHWQERLSLQK